jgi:hypothetical protein
MALPDFPTNCQSAMNNDKILQTGESPGTQARCRTNPSSRIMVVDIEMVIRPAEALTT